jgi:hypothetical protein
VIKQYAAATKIESCGQQRRLTFAAEIKTFAAQACQDKTALLNEQGLCNITLVIIQPAPRGTLFAAEHATVCCISYWNHARST